MADHETSKRFAPLPSPSGWTSWGLAALHFVFAGLIVVSTRYHELPWFAWLGILGGMAFHLSAVWTLRTIRMLPEVGKGVQLITSGPYRIVRHPMYAGLLFATAFLLLAPLTTSRFLIWLALFLDLILKLHREEALMRSSFPHYDERMKNRARLIPGIY